MTVCPQCHSTHTCRVASRSVCLFFPLSLFLVCVRCDSCGWRFLRRSVLADGRKVASKPPYHGLSRSSGSSKTSSRHRAAVCRPHRVGGPSQTP